MQTLGLSDSTPKPTSRLKDLFRPDLSNEVSALTVCHSASWACFIVAIVTAALAIFVNHAAFLDAGNRHARKPVRISNTSGALCITHVAKAADARPGSLRTGSS